jgi:succinoglycan biosynthesis protein ExoM
MSVSVCIATHYRNEALALLLEDLAAQDHLPDEVVIVDNTSDSHALPVVEQCRKSALPFPIVYEVQPVRSISLTRNRTVDLASGEWLAFIDDDERAAPDWLGTLLAAAGRFAAGVVLGPALPIVPAEAPGWIRRGRFYDWPRMPSGTVIPRNRLRFGNVLIHGGLLRGRPLLFNPTYGLTGGEDGALLSRLAGDGARIVWCDEALVMEPVESSRLSLRWLCMRALRGGQDYSRHTLAGRYGAVTAGRVAVLVTRSLVQMCVAAILALLCLPLGRTPAAFWTIKAAANFGKLSLLFGWHYEEYARRATGPAPSAGP